MGRVRGTVDDPPDGSVCSVRNKKPRMSESAILVTQFLFAVVLEMTCNTVIRVISPYIINTLLRRQVMRIKKLNTQRKTVLMFSNIRNE